MAKTVFKKTKSELFNFSADLIAKKLRESLKQKRIVVFAVPGGRSVVPIFKILKNKNLEWNRIHFFMIDERLLPISSNQSNFKLLNNNLLKSLIKQNKLTQDNIHPFVYQKNKSDNGISTYRNELKQIGGKFDVILLSAGEDCHIASLFPSHNSIKNNSEYFMTVSDAPKNPKTRMSASKQLISSADFAILLFVDKRKKSALIKFSDATTSINNCPAKILNQIKNSITITNVKV